MADDFPVPRVSHGVRVDGELFVCLHVHEAREPAVVELDLGGIENVEQVDAEAAVEVGIERTEECRRVGEEVGEDHQRSLAAEQRLGAGERLGDGCA